LAKINIRNKRTLKVPFNDEKKQFTFDEMMEIANQSMKANKKMLDKLAEDD